MTSSFLRKTFQVYRFTSQKKRQKNLQRFLEQSNALRKESQGPTIRKKANKSLVKLKTGIEAILVNWEPQVDLLY